MTKFEEYIVAYIDILGTSEKIKKDVNNSHFELLKNIYEQTNKFIYYNNELKNNFKIFTKLKSKIFSDNIVVFAKCNLYIPPEMDEIIGWVKNFQASALAKGFLTRGGIAQGEFYEDENLVYGKALLEAVELEENIAIYPRVVFSPKINHYNSSLNDVDIDGLHFVNYIHALWFILAINENSPINLCTRSKILKVKKHLISLYSKEVKENIKVLQKYQWLINQYNSFCKGIECGEIKETFEKDMSFEGFYITKEDLEIQKTIKR